MFIALPKGFHLALERFKIRSWAAGIPLSAPDKKIFYFTTVTILQSERTISFQMSFSIA